MCLMTERRVRCKPAIDGPGRWLVYVNHSDCIRYMRIDRFADVRQFRVFRPMYIIRAKAREWGQF